MRTRDVKLLIAAFLALFVVLSPAVHFLVSGGDLSNSEIAEDEIYPIKETNLVGQLAPNPEIKYINGKRVELKDFRGKTVVLYLWSTWSPTAPKGMWYLNQLHLKSNNHELQVLAANIGFRDRKDEIEYYLNRRNLNLPVLLSTPDVLSQFNVQGVPALFVVDKEGIIRYEAVGEIDEEKFREALEKVLDAGTD